MDTAKECGYGHCQPSPVSSAGAIWIYSSPVWSHLGPCDSVVCSSE